MNSRFMLPDDFARLNCLAVQPDYQRFGDIETWQTGDGNLEFQRRRRDHLDFDSAPT